MSLLGYQYLLLFPRFLIVKTSSVSSISEYKYPFLEDSQKELLMMSHSFGVYTKTFIHFKMAQGAKLRFRMCSHHSRPVGS